jgi:hypothetical protein
MRWLLFLSRLAFICGFSFLLAISLLIKPWTKDEDIAGTIIIIGMFMGMLIVPATLICYLIAVIRKKQLALIVPRWLIVCNIVWMFIYLIYLVLNNGNGQHNTPA